MHYATIKKFDIANGPGVRVSLFVSGCTHHCPGCFNPETWDFAYGSPFTEETVSEILTALAPPHIRGLTLLGGEPFEPQNQPVVLDLVRRVRAAYPQKTIWCYTGYLYDQELQNPESPACTEDTLPLLEQLDVLVDGVFIESLKDIRLRFRGSSNQRILDVPRSLAQQEPVLFALEEPEGSIRLEKSSS